MKSRNTCCAILVTVGIISGIGLSGANSDNIEGSSLLTAPIFRAVGEQTSLNLSASVSQGSFDCSMLQKRRVRFSDPGYSNENSVGLFYNFEGAPAGQASLEIFWDEVGKPTERLFYALGEGAVQRNDDGLTDHTGIIGYAYGGVSVTESKVVRANLIVEGWGNNCPTVRRVTVTPGTGGFTTEGSLTTHFNSGNGAQGNYFDIHSPISLRIDAFSVHVAQGGCPPGMMGDSNTTVEVYYRLGSSFGNEQNMAGWIFLGSDTVYQPDVCAVYGTGTRFDIGGLILIPDQNYGIFIRTTAGNSDFMWTDAGPNVYSNPDLVIRTNAGFQTCCNWNLPGSEWNGTIHYSK